MKVSLRTLLIVVTLVAVFCAGWIGGGKYQEGISKAYDASSLTDAQRRVMDDDLQSLLLSGVPEKVEGVVTGTREDLVALSLGTDDGVRPGHVVQIYRGSTHVGSATVTISEHNTAAARMRRTFDDLRAREGDYVTMAH